MVVNFVENNKKLTDNQVVSLINSGEYENLEIIINRYMPLIIKTAKQYCPKEQLEDAVQEATFALYSAVKTFDEQKSSFSAFASICIKRAVIALVRKNVSKKAIPQDLMLPIDQIDLPSPNNPESILIEKEDYKALTNNIKLELSSLEYKVLNKFLDGESYSEIAKSIGIAEKSVANALTRIRKKIKNGT